KACAFKRNIIAKTVIRFPEVLTMLEDGRYSISSAAVVAQHLTEENRVTLLEKTAGKCASEVELIVAQLSARRPGRDSMRVIGVLPSQEKRSEVAVAAGPAPQISLQPAEAVALSSSPVLALEQVAAVDPSAVIV